MAVKVTSESLPERQVKLQIEVDEERHNQAIETAYRKLAPRVQIPGFRPGKAPRPLIEKQLGRHRLLDEAMDQLVPKIYTEVLEQEDISPVAQPAVELVSHEPLVFTATVPLQPVVELGDYAALRVPRDAVNVTEAQIDEAVDELRHRYGTIEPVERAAAKGDILRADIKVSAGDESLFSADEIEFRVTDEALASMPGLVNILVGLKKGDSVSKTAKAPKDHTDEKMAGKTVKYDITLHEVKEEKLADPNDDFAKEVGEGFETMLALRARIREDIEKAETDSNLRNYETEVVDKLVDNASLEYAPQMVEHEIDHILNDQANLDPRDPSAQMIYLQRLGKSEEEVRDSVREQAMQRMRRSLVLSRFAEAENITVEDADIDAEIETMVSSSGEQGEMIRQLFGNDNARDSLARSLHTRKTLARLVEIAEQGGSAPAKKRTASKKAAAEDKPAEEKPAGAKPAAAPKPRRASPRKVEE